MYLAATPLLAVPNSNIFLKLESCNPTGSIRDRAIFPLLSKAPKTDQPLLIRDWGPFALSTAWAAKLLQRELTVVLPTDSPSIFRELLQGYPCCMGEDAVYDLDHYQLVDPSMDPEHPMAYCEGLAEELWYQFNGKIGAIICGTDTCATLMGCSTGLKRRDPNILSVGAPIAKEFYGNHNPLGTADPEFYVQQLCDQLSYISPEAAQQAQNWLKRHLNIPCGIVGGAAFAAAQTLERECDRAIVVILPSRFDCW